LKEVEHIEKNVLFQTVSSFSSVKLKIKNVPEREKH